MSRFLLATLALLGVFTLLEAGMTKEEEACAAPVMTKMNKEPDAKLKKILGDSLKLMNAGKRDQAIRKVDLLTPEQFARLRDYYFIDECAQFRHEFNMDPV